MFAVHVYWFRLKLGGAFAVGAKYDEKYLQ